MMFGFALGLAAAARVPAAASGCGGAPRWEGAGRAQRAPASPLLSLSSNMFHGPTASHGVPVAGGPGGVGPGGGGGDGDGGDEHVKFGIGGGSGGPTRITFVMNWMNAGHRPGNAAQVPFAFKWQSTQNCGVPIVGQCWDHAQP